MDPLYLLIVVKGMSRRKISRWRLLKLSLSPSHLRVCLSLFSSSFFFLHLLAIILTQVFHLDTSVIDNTHGNNLSEGTLVLGLAPIFEPSLEEDISAASPLPEPTPDTPEPSFTQGPIPEMPGSSSHSGGPFPGILSFNILFFLFFFFD